MVKIEGSKSLSLRGSATNKLTHTATSARGGLRTYGPVPSDMSPCRRATGMYASLCDNPLIRALNVGPIKRQAQDYWGAKRNAR